MRGIHRFLTVLLGIVSALAGSVATSAGSGASLVASGSALAGSSVDASEHPADAGKTGVLLVSHGSHSPQWRGMLLDLEQAVSDSILGLPDVGGLKSAFMEYTEPSIATQLRAFDQEGYDQVILVPLLLTVSSHSFDDIPTIYGAKEDARSLETLHVEGIERYTPQARITMTPLLDYSDVLEHNLVRRVTELSRDPGAEAVVIVAYGSEPYEEEWNDTFTHLSQRIAAGTGARPVVHTWCGHIVEYDPEPTTRAILELLQTKERVIVVPALVARDEMFQDRIIGEAVTAAGAPDRVIYRPDAVLPEPRVNGWIIETVRTTAEALRRQ